MIFGIDTASVANRGTTINWAQVRAAGASFAFHRASYGDGIDGTFRKNWPAMQNAGLVCGAYMFLTHPFQGKNAPEPAAQVAAFERSINGAGGLHDANFPPVLDIEFPGKGRADTGMTGFQLMGRVVAAAEALRDAYGSLMLYTSSRVIREDLQGYPFPDWMNALPFWLAKYPFKEGPYVVNADAFKGGKNDPDTLAAVDGNWWAHQYQGNATGFPGCGDSPVDMNRFVALAAGDTGDRVRWVQDQLNLPRTGNFGPALVAAVREFQGFCRLVNDGVIGPKTFVALCHAHK